MSLLDEIRKLITGDSSLSRNSSRGMNIPVNEEMMGLMNTIQEPNRLVGDISYKPDNYIAPNPDGLINKNAPESTIEGYAQNFMDGVGEIGQVIRDVSPFGLVEKRQLKDLENQISKYNDSNLIRPDYKEPQTEEQKILDSAKQKAETNTMTEGSPNFISYGQNKPVTDTKPTLSQADVDKLTANYTIDGQPYNKDNTDVSFLDKVGDFVGNKERMLKLALAFNSMRLEPDQGLATALNDRLKTLSKQGKASSTADYLRSKGRPDLAELVLKNPELSTQALTEVRQSNKFKILTGAQLEKEYGIKGLPSKASYKYNTMSGEVSGVGQGNTIINTVKADTGYQLVYDEEGRVSHQVPVEKLPTKEELKILDEQASAKSIAGTVIVNAGNNIADKLFGGNNFMPVTGTLGGITADLIGESDARVIKRNVEVLGANASIETLQNMRKQSPTGGALGNVTERELAMLKNSKGALDQTNDVKDFTKAYLQYMNIMFKVVYGDTSELGQKYGVTAGQKAYEEWLSGIKSKYKLDDNMQRTGDVQTTDPQSQVINFDQL